MKYKLDIIGFKVDKLDITKEEFEMVMGGKDLKWLVGLDVRVWPSMNKYKKIGDFE